MTDPTNPQPKEVARPACATCSGFLKQEASIPARERHPGYDIMRCVNCGSIAWFEREEK
jgi:RNase P subunit RPR2